jgi:molecular chaperone DnaK
VIKASSGLSDDEVDRMVADAEAHAEEDRKFRELVDARNQADGLIHAAEKTLEELGEKASSEERLAVESAISDLKSAIEKDDKEAITAKTSALAEASGGLAQRLYAEQQAEASGDASSDASGDDIVDAEFEEVDKDDESKSA